MTVTSKVTVIFIYSILFVFLSWLSATRSD
jgi:hypothetical protein